MNTIGRVYQWWTSASRLIDIFKIYDDMQGRGKGVSVLEIPVAKMIRGWPE
jgi:hypothetical protein